MASTVICVNCGTENAGDAEACVRCGQPLAADVRETPTRRASARDGSATETPADPSSVDDGEETAPPDEPAAPPDTPPPGAPPPSPPGGGNGAVPAPPRHPIPAGVAALIAIGAIILVGALIRVTFLRPHDAVTPTPTITVTTARPTTPAKPPPTKPPPTKPALESVTVSGCRSIGRDASGFTCVGPAFTYPATSAGFAVMVWVENSKPGQALTLAYLDPQTGQALKQPDGETLTGHPNCQLDGAPAECAAVTFGPGPFARIDIELVVAIDGARVRFQTAPILHLV